MHAEDGSNDEGSGLLSVAWVLRLQVDFSTIPTASHRHPIGLPPASHRHPICFFTGRESGHALRRFGIEKSLTEILEE
ncbi:hypothetical protein IFM47457_04922 [Aspergillus lentulus]|nr:hypothetical protein IFM47457_04922 [Aspergillus lentulus]